MLSKVFAVLSCTAVLMALLNAGVHGAAKGCRPFGSEAECRANAKCEWRLFEYMGVNVTSCNRRDECAPFSSSAEACSAQPDCVANTFDYMGVNVTNCLVRNVCGGFNSEAACLAQPECLWNVFEYMGVNVTNCYLSP